MPSLSRLSFRASAIAVALLLSPALSFAQESATPAKAPPSGKEIAETTARRDAKVAMEHWLGLIEEGKFVESWREASAQFQQSIGAGRWATTCRNTRRPTGKLLSRDLAEEYYHTEYYRPDGHLAKGEMVTFIFTTHFEHLKDATEIVILQPFDNKWRVVSYSLKPKFDAPKS